MSPCIPKQINELYKDLQRDIPNATLDRSLCFPKQIEELYSQTSADQDISNLCLPKQVDALVQAILLNLNLDIK
jgi:hypothetical protein